MQAFIIGVTFLLGVIVLVAGLFAFFKGRKGGAGKAKFLGIEISGSGGALVLLVGVVLVLSGFGWATSQQQTAQAHQDKIACVEESKQVTAAASQLHSQLQTERQLRQELLTQLPAATRQQIEVQRPNLTRFSAIELPPAVRQKILVH